MISWVIARATARERGLSPLTIAIAVVLALVACFSSSADAWAGLTFEVLTLLVGAGLLADELESGHAQLVLLRPLTRAQWLGGRLAGAALVLASAALLATLAGAQAAIFRGLGSETLPRLAVLPLTLLPAFAWLATLVALSAVARGWTNAGIVIAVYFGWKIAKFSLPLALHRLDLQPLFEGLDRYFGPQELISLPAGTSLIERAAWDVLWVFASWTSAVRLFNLRELARRRP